MAETERVWRVRRNARSIDAQVRDVDTPPGTEIHYVYDGALIYRRHWPTRALALTDATERLRELQLAGWATHW